MTTTVTEADIPKILANIRQHESGGNYKAKSKKGGAEGAYQFIKGTWQSNARAAGVDINQYPTAATAPPEIQDKVAALNVRNILQAHGWDAEAVPAVWYIGHIPNAAEWDKVPMPQYGNTATPRQYVSQWMKTYNGSTGSTPASGGITAGQTAVGNMTDQDIAQFIASNYGFAAAYLNHEEIGPILIQAAREKWTPTKLQGAIMNTTWWKTTSASVRQFQQLAASDPTTAQAQIASRQSILSDAASKLGLSLAPDRLKTIAYHSLAFGWNQNQIDDALAEEVHYSPEAAQKGQIGANSAQVKALAAKYYLTVSDEAAFDYAKQLVTGQIDQGGIEATFISQAKGKFPTLAKYIDQGTTPSQFFSPYKSILAKEFDMPETSIDLANDPQFQPILSMAGQDGTLRPMSLSETTKWARTQPRWDATKGAKDQAAQFGEMLTSMFGATK